MFVGEVKWPILHTQNINIDCSETVNSSRLCGSETIAVTDTYQNLPCQNLLGQSVCVVILLHNFYRLHNNWTQSILPLHDYSVKMHKASPHQTTDKIERIVSGKVNHESISMEYFKHNVCNIHSWKNWHFSPRVFCQNSCYSAFSCREERLCYHKRVKLAILE